MTNVNTAELLKSSDEFKYMLLARLVSDCYSYFDYGGKLWGIDKETHAKTMLSIYNNLKKKPEWISTKEFKNIIQKLS